MYILTEAKVYIYLQQRNKKTKFVQVSFFHHSRTLTNITNCR